MTRSNVVLLIIVAILIGGAIGYVMGSQKSNLGQMSLVTVTPSVTNTTTPTASVSASVSPTVVTTLTPAVTLKANPTISKTY